MKRKISIVMVSVMAVLFLATAINYAANVEKFEPPIAEPFKNYLVIDNEAIGNSGKQWSQPAGFPYYRVWVRNDTNETMWVTVSYTYGNGNEGSHRMVIGANSEDTLKIVDARPGFHYIGFMTSSGIVEGRVSVRVSDEPSY